MTNDGSHTYTYDAEGNITKVDSGTTAAYLYDALNHRVRTTVGTAHTEFVFNQNGQRVSVWNASNNTVERDQYYWGNTPVAFANGGSVHFQHQDWLGTERTRTTYNGSVEGTYTSLPFGDGYAPSGSDQDPYHYAQLDYDSETATSHAQYRQDSTTQGRWMSPDPYYGSYDSSNPQTFNRYSYVLSNPLGFVDPLGFHLEQIGNCVFQVETATVNGQYDSTAYYLIGCYGGGSVGGQAAGGGGGGGGGGGTQSNTSSCVAGVLAQNAVSLGVDLLGTLPIPEAGGITRLVGQELGIAKIGTIYRGAVADAQGSMALNGLRNTVSAGVLGGNASDTSALGLASTAVGGAALTAGYFVPVLGQILSGGQLVIDSIHTYNTIKATCYGQS